MDVPLDDARTLLRKASHDLRNAGHAIHDAEIADTVCFHAQQAAEKSLKALLALAEQEYPWTHDVRRLMGRVVAIHPDLVRLQDDAEPLTRYAVDARYLGVADPTPDEAAAALATARAIYEFAAGVLAQQENASQEG
jgi:HEPN domain-containing protein